MFVSALKGLAIAFLAILLLVISYTLISLIFSGVIYRSLRAELPNGTYLARSNLLASEAVLRDREGSILVRDVAYVVFNEGYVAGELYTRDDALQRFVFRVGDTAAVMESPTSKAEFDRLFGTSGLANADWPVGWEDVRWLDYGRLIRDERYRRRWLE